LIRHHQDPIPPLVLFQNTTQPGAYDEVVTEWGELSR
jgi:hypothetical protein